MIAVVLLFAVGAVAQLYNTQTLDGNGMYNMSWGITGDKLEVKVVVKTTGWIGFGFSPNGGMPGSDVVMGWINPDGIKSFSDRTAVTNALPVKDDSQDYELLEL